MAEKSKKWPQIVAAFAATIGAFVLGTSLGWTSPALPNLEDDVCGDECDIDGITATDASWISSVMPLAAMLSGPPVGYLLAKIGRRWTMILLAVPMSLGYMLFVIAYELGIDDKNARAGEALIFTGRILTGFGGGAFALAAPLYIVEIADPSMRGALASLMQFMVTMGVAFVDGLNINDAVHWNIISAICMCLPVALVLIMFFMPESPYYLILKNKEKQAIKSIMWLRGKEYDAEGEIAMLNDRIEQEFSAGAVSLKTMFTHGVYAKPLFIVVMLMFLQQFCGINAVIFYTQIIFEDAGANIESDISAFIVASAQVLGTGVAVLIVERFGRKILLIVSDFVMGVAILALGVFFYLKDNQKCPTDFPTDVSTTLDYECTTDGKFDPDLIEQLGWLPLTSLIIYIIFFSIGFGPLPWAMNAELHSAEAKATASAIAFSFNWFCAFLVTKFYPNIEDLIKAQGAYMLFSIICFFGTFFIIAFVPETRGKSPAEIRAYFQKEKVPEKRVSITSFKSVVSTDSSVKSSESQPRQEEEEQTEQ